jgi:hypothetical protein
MTRQELSMFNFQTQPVVFTEEGNADLPAFSALYSARLNGSGPVNKFHPANGTRFDPDKAALRDFLRYADPGIRQATGNRLDVHLFRPLKGTRLDWLKVEGRSPAG